MSPDKIIKFWLVGATFLMLTQSAVKAQTAFLGNTDPTEINQLSVPQTLVIPPITQTEILPSNVTAAGGSISESVSSERDLLSPPQFSTNLIREFPTFWKMRVPIEQVGLLRAKYELRGANGSGDAVSNLQNPSSKLPVTIEPLPIREISRDQNSNTALVEGGVRLRMDLSPSQSAGAYLGELTVTVDLAN